MAWPWQKQPPRSKIERTLTNEPDQLQRDRGMAWGLYEKLAERDPKRAAKLLEQFEREAINQWQTDH